MTVLVTGGAGYIGCHMAYELLDAGEKVVILDNLSTGLPWAVPQAATFVKGDVGDQPLVESVLRQHGIKSIIHFAASIVVPDSVTDPLGYYFNNTVKTRALIESAVRCGVEHFIFSSTAAVYGMTGDAPVVETATLNPMSPYGSSKLMSEIILRDTSNAFPMRHVALRYFNVAGADPKGRTGQSTPRATHLIKVAAETALGKRNSMSVFGTDYETPDGTCQRDYIHVTDLVGAHVVALRHLRNGGASDVFNCGYGRGFSVLEVIDAVKRVSGVDFRVDIAPRRPGDPARIVACSDKIRGQLGWKPRFDDLDTIVGHALSWEKQLTLMPKVA